MDPLNRKILHKLLIWANFFKILVEVAIYKVREIRDFLLIAMSRYALLPCEMWFYAAADFGESLGSWLEEDILLEVINVQHVMETNT